MARIKLKQKLYQLVISRLDGARISSPTYQETILELVQKGVGGFIVFGGDKEEVKDFINKLQSAAGIPLFIASDIERGVGQQLTGATSFPPQMAIASAINKNNNDDIQILKDTVKAVADEAADIGINMPFIPVLDVNNNPDNPIICTRAFSDRPEEVAWYGNIYIKVIEESGLISCAKHFPGHGDTSVDSHIALPVISKSRQEIMDTDILPFKKAIETGTSSIMMGHLSIPALDSVPASLSWNVISGILRRELGFEGLILTDALNMDALKEIAGVPVKCLNVGVDIILHPADADEVVDELKAAVDSGELDESRIDIAVERILKYKSKINNIKKSEINHNRNHELSELLSTKSIALVKDSDGIVPMNNFDDFKLIFTSDEKEHDLLPLKNIMLEPVRVKDCIIEEIKQPVIISLFTTIAAWRGSSGVDPEEIETIKKIIRKAPKSIVISFGSPYVMRHLNEADLLIAAYDSSHLAQLCVIKCLKGEEAFTGELPVNLDLS
jgi:beta-glucosidase-like glycosyl hydrolase